MKGPFLVKELAASVESCSEDLSEWSMFRKHTLALLRHFFRLSMEHGRVPCMLGSSVTRARISHRRMHTLEDDTILLHDIERCMTRELNECEMKLVALMVFLEHTIEETARTMNLCERQVYRMYPDALNRLTRAFSEHGLLNIQELRPTLRKPMASMRLENVEASAAM